MQTPDDLMKLSPQAFVQFCKAQGISRFYFVYDRDKDAMISSHSRLQPIADFIHADKRDFMKHEGLFFWITRRYDTLQGAFVHRTNRGQAAGGVRYWHYETLEDYIRDGLRLAKGMTRKNALAGLWWGGGKGVMAHNPAVDKADPGIRASIYRAYGDLMTSIRGCYVTAEDVGTNVEDMAQLFARTRFTTCIPHDVGGSGNPSIPTARGVVSGMEAALAFTSNETLEGKTVAVQGMGNVGAPLMEFLFERKVKKIIASDVNPDLVEKRKREFTGRNLDARAVEGEDDWIFRAECDILSPCATGAVLNPRTIPKIKARIVCGAANNQLEEAERDDRLLHERGIVYIPDFLTNRMGIVNCANEQYGYVNNDPLIEKHLTRDWEFSIFRMATKVLEESRSAGEPPGRMALSMADELSLKNHPLFGHRGQQIIDSLVADRWHEGF
jgi:leucine dehydrogenase